MNRLILASSSPRRRELLSEAGFPHEVFPPRPSAEDEAPRLPDAAELVVDLARRKAWDVVQQLRARLPERPVSADAWVLAADTVAECSGQILGKPIDEADARRILTALSGTEHRVLSGVCLWRLDSIDAPAECLYAESVLRMDELTHDWLDDYLRSDAWEGKAGAFGYQDGLGFVRIISGSESNVVGLPMPEVRAMLARSAGITPAGQGR